MSEVNYRRNGMKYSTPGRCWGMAPKAGGLWVRPAGMFFGNVDRPGYSGPRFRSADE